MNGEPMPQSEAELAVFYYDLAVREIERVTRGQVTFVIVHRYATGVTGMRNTRPKWRIPGAEIVSVWLIFRGKPYQLPLGGPHKILFDYLCWHCAGIGQSAAEIEAGLNEQLFYVHHASAAKRRSTVLARSSRTNIRKQAERIRGVMNDLFREEFLPLDPKDILRSEPTSTREVRYSIRANVIWQY
jgi:hypothetical protein